MKTLGTVLKLATEYLKERQDQRPRLHAEELLSFVLKLPRLDLYLQFDRPLQEDELDSYRSFLKRKAEQEPIEYILGETIFYQCPLIITPSVLIPRPETEILLDMVCQRLKDRDVKKMQAWDLCCGSGCLGIGLKKTYPQLDLTLSDLSLQALEIAKINCERNGIVAELLQGDLLTPFQGREADLVLCNPPYVSQKEFNALDPSVRDFEPSIALLGGENGLIFYERLAQELPAYLRPGALAFLEIGSQQKDAVFSLFSASCWKTKEIKKDWAGHDRFFFLEFE